MWRFLLLFYSLLSTSQLWATPLILAEKGQYRLAPHVSFHVDITGEMTFEDTQIDGSIPWIENGEEDLNFGFLSHPVWLKIPITNHNSLVDDWALEIGYPHLDHVDVYFTDQYNQLIQLFYGGDKESAYSRNFYHPHLVFPAELFPYEPVTLYMRVQTDGANQIPLVIWQWDDFNYYSLTHFLIQGLFYGMVLIMALYNFVVWMTERQSIYLHYVSYILLFTIFQTSLSGIGFQYVWPDSPWLNSLVTPVSLSLLVAALFQFIGEFFDTEKNFYKIYLSIKMWVFICIITAILALFAPYHIAIVTSSILTSTCLLYVVFIAVYMLKVKHPSSRYFALAWSMFLGGALLLTANKFGLVPITLASEYGLQFGAGMEIMFLSLALADRMARNQKEKIKAQEESLNLAHEINAERERTFEVELENLRLEKKANDELERQVEERTEELQGAMEKLSIAHEKLQTISITDALTNLYNRYYFNEHWQIEFKRAFRDKNDIALIMMDIDHFKKVNDTYGHPAGDACLKVIAECISKHASRESDIACRYGGEEFAIILPNTPESGAFDVAENIRMEIQSRTIKWETVEFKVTASLGLTASQPKTSDEKGQQFFINQADQALYKAKGQGRNQVAVFTQDVW